MNFLSATIATAAVSLGAIAGCQPAADQFQPGIPVVEQSPVPVYNGGHASQPATRVVCTVQGREMDQPAPGGCQLDLYMSLDTIDGVSPEQRCYDRGGTPRYLNPLINCIDVDY